MTLHVASVYFDREKQCVGYLLGSDRLTILYPEKEFVADGRMVIVHQIKPENRHFENKAFFGTSTVGFYSGRFKAVPRGQTDETLRSLDNCFDDIEDSKEYKDNYTLTESPYYYLSIVKRSEDALELFSVTKRRGAGYASRIHRMTRKDYTRLQRTAYWKELNIPRPASSHKNFSGKQDKETRIEALQREILAASQRRPLTIGRRATLYAIDFEGIHQVV